MVDYIYDNVFRLTGGSKWRSRRFTRKMRWEKTELRHWRYPNDDIVDKDMRKVILGLIPLL